MQAAAAPPAPPPPPPARRRVYTAVDPPCEWRSTEEADTLTVDVSGFRKEELKVLYNTRRKLKVTGERQVGGAQWARFLKVFPVPRSCDAGAIQAKMNIESARLLVILPKGSAAAAVAPPSKDKRAGRSQTLGELMRPGDDDGSSGSSSGSMWSAQEDPVKGKVGDKEHGEDQAVEEPRQDQAMTIQDLPRSGGANGNAAAENGDGDGKGEDKRWWKKIRVLHVLGFVLVLALVGVGATILYIVLL